MSSNVIHADFGTEREWKRTHERTVEGLVKVGSYFGDDEALMRAKAECVYGILRAIVDDVPGIQISSRLPEDLTPEQLAMTTEAIKAAALRGVEAAMSHFVAVLMGSIYDLCTSRLSSPMN